MKSRFQNANFIVKSLIPLLEGVDELDIIQISLLWFLEGTNFLIDQCNLRPDFANFSFKIGRHDGFVAER